MSDDPDRDDEQLDDNDPDAGEQEPIDDELDLAEPEAPATPVWSTWPPTSLRPTAWSARLRSGPHPLRTG